MLIPPTIWPFRPPSSNSNLQTGSAQQHGKRVREGRGGEVLCLPANTEQCVSIQLKFYFWLSHTFVCMCDRFWAKWEFGHFSIFLWFSDNVGLWGISRSHDMYRAQKLESAVVKDAPQWLLCLLVAKVLLYIELGVHISTWSYCTSEMHSNCPSPYLTLSKNYAELWGCTPSLAN